MGRKWRRMSALTTTPPVIQKDDSSNEMIEHSIKKYERKITSIHTQQQHSHYQGPRRPITTAFENRRKEWNKQELLNKIEEVKKEGYTIGRNICSCFGAKGSIVGYREITDDLMTFYDEPTLIAIKRDEGYSSKNVFYKASELQFID